MEAHKYNNLIVPSPLLNPIKEDWFVDWADVSKRHAGQANDRAISFLKSNFNKTRMSHLRPHV